VLEVVDDDGAEIAPDKGSEKLGDILAAMGESDEGEDYTIKVYEVAGSSKNGGVEVWLADVKPEDVPGLQTHLRDTYGSGTYRLRIYHRGPHTAGRSELAHVSTYHIKAIPRATPALAVPTLRGDESALVTAIQQQSQLLASVVEKLTNPGGNDTEARFLATLKIVKEMMPTPAPAPTPEAKSESHFELFMRGVEFARDTFSGGGGDGSSFAELAREAFRSPALKAAVERLAPATAAAPAVASQPQPPHLSAPPTPRPTPPTQTQPAAQQRPTMQQVQMHLAATLVYEISLMAERGAPVEEAMDYVEEYAPESMIQQIVEDDTIVSQLILLVPAAEKHRAYLDELHKQMRAAYTLPEAPGPQGASSKANGAHAAQPGSDGDGGDAAMDASPNP